MNDNTTDEARDDRRRRVGLAARITLAGVAVLGVGAALTTAAWTDEVYFGIGATAESFDLQGREPGGTWQDVGLPGDTSGAAPIVLTLEDVVLSPSEDIDVPFELCNVGTADGTITAISTPTLSGDLFDATGVAATVTVTIESPAVGAAVASDPTCASPVTGNVNIVTSALFPASAMGLSGDIGFVVTGESS